MAHTSYTDMSTSDSTRPRPSRRDHLVATAVELFAQHGYHATGIDKILAAAGVAKMTLYGHFRSKDELILAALRRWDEESRNWLVRAIEARAEDPAERLLVLFDVLDEWFESNGFNGCMFINATAEYPDPEDPIHVAAAEHKRLFGSFIHKQCIAAGVPDPSGLSAQILLLMEGAIVTAHVQGSPGVGARARRAAEILVAHAADAPNAC